MDRCECGQWGTAACGEYRPRRLHFGGTECWDAAAWCRRCNHGVECHDAVTLDALELLGEEV